MTGWLLLVMIRKDWNSDDYYSDDGKIEGSNFLVFIKFVYNFSDIYCIVIICLCVFFFS